MEDIMKKIAIILFLLIPMTLALFAQETSEGTSSGSPAGTSGDDRNLFVTESTYYRVYSEISTEHARETARKLDGYLKLFNTHFRFNLETLDTKLNVRIFENKERFNDYLQNFIDQEKDNFVYLQFQAVADSELVGFSQKTEQFETSLIRHSFIQFFKSFIKNPPPWMLKGFAIYFEDSYYDKEHQYAVYKENLSWLNTLKNTIRKSSSADTGSDQGLIPLPQFLNPSEKIMQERPRIYHAQSWGFISFLQETDNKNYNRLLWDAISALQPEASMAENISAIGERTFNWVNGFLLFNDFKNYILSLKTFPELVRSGIDLYSAGNLDQAEESFLEAILINGSHHLPYYYLGLIHYTKDDYSLAEYYYQSSLMLGAEKSLIHYALGVNAFADHRLEDATNYLEEAKRISPDEYGEKVDTLLTRIDGLKEKEASQGM